MRVMIFMIMLVITLTIMPANALKITLSITFIIMLISMLIIVLIIGVIRLDYQINLFVIDM